MPDPRLLIPFATVRTLTEFEQMGAVFAGWQGQIEQTSSGQFTGSIQVVAGGLIRAVAAEGNQRLRVRGRDGSGMLAIYPMCDRMARCAWNRGFVDPGQIYLGGAEDEIDIGSERQFSGRVAFLDPQILDAAARSLLQLDDVSAFRHSTIRSPPPEVFSLIDRQLNRLLGIGLANPSLIGTPEGHLLEQECLRALVTALFPSGESDAERSVRVRSKLLDRAEEYLRSRIRDPVGMIELCQETGANDRTLRLAFHERYGIGPITYFRFLRLNAVRAKLRTDPRLTIAQAAAEFGFHHLGNFAADYRRLFGISPSETKRLRTGPV